jgi:hypothetical protein
VSHPTSSSDTLKVIYIAGVGHSGSTLLGLLLGSHPQVFSAGELLKIPRYQWGGEEFSRQRRQCMCGELARDCPVWGEVFQLLERDSHFHSEKLKSSEPHETPLDLMAQANHQVYKALQRVTGKGVIVDSTKKLSYLRELLRIPDIELFIVQLVRDPRAILQSTLRKRAETTDPKYSFKNAISSWNATHAELLKLREQGHSHAVVRYEDLVEDPAAILKSLQASFGIGFEESQLSFRSVQHHVLGGNSMRFRTEESEIKGDDSYKTELSLADWTLATVISYPLLKQFGYALQREL